MVWSPWTNPIVFFFSIFALFVFHLFEIETWDYFDFDLRRSWEPLVGESYSAGVCLDVSCIGWKPKEETQKDRIHYSIENFLTLF